MTRFATFIVQAMFAGLVRPGMVPTRHPGQAGEGERSEIVEATGMSKALALGVRAGKFAQRVATWAAEITTRETEMLSRRVAGCELGFLRRGHSASSIDQRRVGL
jgi:hypothetical protein